LLVLIAIFFKNVAFPSYSNLFLLVWAIRPFIPRFGSRDEEDQGFGVEEKFKHLMKVLIYLTVIHVILPSPWIVALCYFIILLLEILLVSVIFSMSEGLRTAYIRMDACCKSVRTVPCLRVLLALNCCPIRIKHPLGFLFFGTATALYLISALVKSYQDILEKREIDEIQEYMNAYSTSDNLDIGNNDKHI
jgi:hypothetical protein